MRRALPESQRVRKKRKKRKKRKENVIYKRRTKQRNHRVRRMMY